MLMNTLLNTSNPAGSGLSRSRMKGRLKRIKHVPLGEMWGIVVIMIVLLGAMVVGGAYVF